MGHDSSTPQTGREEYFHPLRPDHVAHPYEVLKRTREQCPVHEFLPGLYFLACDSDVRAALTSPQLSSAQNMELEGTGDPPNLAQLDGEAHRRVRHLVESSLNARSYKNAQPFIEQTVHTLLQELLSAPDHQADLMPFARRLTASTLAHILGIPEAEVMQALRWLAAIIAFVPGNPATLDEWWKLEEYIFHLMDQYRHNPDAPDTAILRLVQEEVQGHMSRREVKSTIFLLLGAGSDTTMMLIGNLFYELLRIPERWERIKVNLSLAFNAVEETLRLHSPTNWVLRSCPAGKPFIVRDQQIPPESRVFIGLHSANRDEARWGANAGEFDLDRQGIARHVAFGQGIHFCPGAELARLQARTALTIVARERPSLRLQPGYQYDPMPGNLLHGPKTLLVSW